MHNELQIIYPDKVNRNVPMKGTGIKKQIYNAPGFGNEKKRIEKASGVGNQILKKIKR